MFRLFSPLIGRKIAVVFHRDLVIASGYRAAFLLSMVEALFSVATLYYLSRFIEGSQLLIALPQGKSYFAFALVGLAFFNYLSVSIDCFDRTLDEARQNGTLE